MDGVNYHLKKGMQKGYQSSKSMGLGFATFQSCLHKHSSQ